MLHWKLQCDVACCWLLYSKKSCTKMLCLLLGTKSNNLEHQIGSISRHLVGLHLILLPEKKIQAHKTVGIEYNAWRALVKEQAGMEKFGQTTAEDLWFKPDLCGSWKMEEWLEWVWWSFQVHDVSLDSRAGSRHQAGLGSVTTISRWC